MTYFLFFSIAYSVLAAWAPRLWAVTVPQIALFAAVLIVCVRPALGQKQYNPNLPFPWPAFVPAVIALFGALQYLTHSTAYRFATANTALDYAGYAACAYLASTVPLRSSKLLTQITYFAGTIAVLAILTALTSPSRVFWLLPSQFPQVFGPYVYRNHLAAFAELTLPIALYLAMVHRERRIFLVGIAAVLVSAVVVAGSRTGVIVLAAEIFAMVAVAAAKQWLAPRAAVTFSLLALACISAGAAATGTANLQSRFAEDHPYRVRFEILQSTLDMARARPLTGWGLGNFRTVYPEYGRIDPGVLVNEAHNDWAQWAAEGGIPTAALMLIFAAWSVRAGLRTGWSLGIPAVFCHALVDYPFEETSIVLLLMLLAGLAWNSRFIPARLAH